jgi:hypothetical protein
MTKTRTGKSRSGKSTNAVGLDIQEATASYEQWMGRCTTVILSDLRSKHEQMQESPFLFLRGTFYRWAQQWSSICSDLCDAPEVLAVGDLHVNSFGTWRDVEGRLCWGVDDFDEAFRLPYNNDLVRLAASMKIVIDAEGLSIKVKAGCDAILEGYVRSLKAGGRPLVLAEREQKLGKLGIDSFKPPTDFWDKLNQLPPVRQELAPDVKRALEKTLPDPQMEYRVVRRQAGLGSLGQQRFVAIGEWRGGYVAREAKAVLPSACVWVMGEVGHGQSNYEDAISSAVRPPDPFQVIQGSWLIRRLSPDSNPIDIQTLPKHSDEQMILHAMGAEAANVHVGTQRQAERILKDLNKRKANWLRDSANRMAAAVGKDWKRYKKL